MESPNLLKKRYISIRQLSEYTSLPVKTLYEWSSTGRIPSIKIARRVLFDLKDVDKLMTSLKRNTNQGEETSDNIVGDMLINDI